MSGGTSPNWPLSRANTGVISAVTRTAGSAIRQPINIFRMLAPVYGWFTEGFDTRDLKEAKALLEELAA